MDKSEPGKDSKRTGQKTRENKAARKKAKAIATEKAKVKTKAIAKARDTKFARDASPQQQQPEAQHTRTVKVKERAHEQSSAGNEVRMHSISAAGIYTGTAGTPGTAGNRSGWQQDTAASTSLAQTQGTVEADDAADLDLSVTLVQKSYCLPLPSTPPDATAAANAAAFNDAAVTTDIVVTTSAYQMTPLPTSITTSQTPTADASIEGKWKESATKDWNKLLSG